MKLRVVFTVLAVLALAASARAQSPKPLMATDLYRTIAHGCRSVPLSTWHHPTGDVLRRRNVKLDALELCNRAVYPIYHVAFAYDPRSANTNSFFLPLYDAMLKANGRHPLAFVDAQWNWITMISWTKDGIVETSDEFQP